MTKKYPHRAPAQILADLVRYSPSDEGKWFAATKDAGLFEALAIVGRLANQRRVLAVLCVACITFAS